MNIEPIAHIRTDLPQKFGIPRQSGLAADLQGTIVFEPAYAIETAVRGLEEFTHLWIIWEFENGATGGTASDIASDTGTASKSGTKQGWSPTVRPPRLGGSTRMGVFATRSPFRPNPLGLSCVRIDRIEMTHEGPVIHVLGADLRDGTPIYDIKPYIPYADCQPGATGGFTDRIEFKPELEVDISAEQLECIPKDKHLSLMQVLGNDPRPAYHNDPERIYGLAFAGFNIRFTVDATTLHVVDVAPV